MSAPVTAPRKSLAPWLLDSVNFYEHQVSGIRTLLRMKSFLLADDMGLGKSLQALTVFCADVKTGQGQNCIVVCPVSLRGNWADEIEKFTSIPFMLLGEELDPSTGKIRTLGPTARSAQIVEFMSWSGPKILIVNYEQVTAHLQELNRITWRVGIYDEAQAMKNPKSKRTLASLELRTERNFMLTGTPVLNRVDELWALLNKISPRHFPSYYKFVNRYCVFGGYKNKQIIGVKNMRELQNILSQVMLRRLKRDVLDLPEVQYIQHAVDLHPEQQRLYDKAYELMELESLDPNLPPKEISNALEKFLRLKQICGTPACLGYADNSYKLDAVVSDSEGVINSDNKLVVFTQFRGVLESLEKRYADVGLPVMTLHGDVNKTERQPVVREWSAASGGVILLCMSQVAGIGLNMTAARHGFFVDKLFVPGLNRQCVDRLNRIGASTTQPVQIKEYIARRTVEHRIEQILRGKEKLFDNVIEGTTVVQYILKALRGSV